MIRKASRAYWSSKRADESGGAEDGAGGGGNGGQRTYIRLEQPYGPAAAPWVNGGGTGNGGTLDRPIGTINAMVAPAAYRQLLPYQETYASLQGNQMESATASFGAYGAPVGESSVSNTETTLNVVDPISADSPSAGRLLRPGLSLCRVEQRCSSTDVCTVGEPRRALPDGVGNDRSLVGRLRSGHQVRRQHLHGGRLIDYAVGRPRALVSLPLLPQGLPVSWTGADPRLGHSSALAVLCAFAPFVRGPYRGLKRLSRSLPSPESRREVVDGALPPDADGVVSPSFARLRYGFLMRFAYESNSGPHKAHLSPRHRSTESSKARRGVRRS